MEIKRIGADDVDALAPLDADFRVALRSYKGDVVQPDVQAGREELLYYLEKGYPIFAAVEQGQFLGYAVCRIDDGCVWAEALYVRPEYRRRHVASALFDCAEALARSYEQDTVYNYVHPNNDGVIAFLRSRGYDVLNLIEIRKPYAGEAPGAVYRVGNNDFRY